MSNAYIKIPNSISFNSIVEKDYALSSSQYMDLMMSNENFLFVKDFLKKHGVDGTREQSELFVKNSKKMIALVRQNTEINSEDMLKILVPALSEYVKKLSKDISQCDHLELDKIRKLRDEMNNAQAKIFFILRSFSIGR